MPVTPVTLKAVIGGGSRSEASPGQKHEILSKKKLKIQEKFFPKYHFNSLLKYIIFELFS
jgi:hypothetical protein